MKKITFISMALVAFVLCSAQVFSDVIVIANPSVTEDSLSARDVRDVFLGSRARLRSGAVTPVLQREGAAHEAFLSAYIGRTPVQFQTHWRNIVFTGRGRALASFDSETDLVEYVQETSGAIGYISASTPHDGVKVIAVE